MEWKIAWDQPSCEGMKSAQTRAGESEGTAQLMQDLQAGALLELTQAARTDRQIAALMKKDPAFAILRLGQSGMTRFSMQGIPLHIEAELAPCILKMQCCMALNVINQVEKLHPLMQRRSESGLMELRVPLGAKRGLGRIEMLLTMLYPWLTVRESALSIVAEEATAPEETPVSPKKTFWQKLFGMKN